MEKTCVYPDCGRKPESIAKPRYCYTHTGYLRSGLPLRAIRVFAKSTNVHIECSISFCRKASVRFDFCTNHTQIARRMGILPQELEAIYATGCLVCGSFKKLTLDHDHACCPGVRACGACIRGALCNSCNFRLGTVEKNKHRAQGLLDYANANKHIEGLTRWIGNRSY